MFVLISILFHPLYGVNVIENPLSNVKEPKYYHGDACNKYWMCYEGYEWPSMTCPGSDLVYNPSVERCDTKENSVCPGNDFRGHIEQNLIFPELVVHSTCGFRNRNGEYLLYNKTFDFMTLDLCGYKQSCDETGKLHISQCPNGQLWNDETDECVPSDQMPVCEPASQ